VFDYALKKPTKTASGVTDAAKKKRKSGKLTDADITRLARPGETWETARSRLNQIPLEI